ncbi:DUF4232 domain-containing protein [Streptomyces sp. NPDC050423]|uniref:DUF4232 domain-containing protein n=1 Tax=Streptomyces sp. NPDC050423 TaxID=3155402 RepID=UPI00341CE930
MRLRTISLAAAVLVAGLGLTACNDDSGTGAGADPSSPAAAQQSSGVPESPASGDTSGTGGEKGTGGDKSTAGGTGSSSGGSGGNAAAKCRTADLGFAVDPGGEAQSAGSEGHVTVTLTNKGTAPCTLNGYPGVDLMSFSGNTWSMARQASDKPKAYTVDPGGDTYFTVTYLSYSAEGNSKENEFKTATMSITPPGETESKDLTWPHKAPVLLQDGATHPGTYVSPVKGE